MTQISVTRSDFAAQHRARLDALRSDPEVKKELGRLKKASQDIEAIFLKQLVGEMRKTATKGLFGDSLESQMYADFLDEAVAIAMSRGRGVGMSNQIYRSMEEPVLQRFAAKTARIAANPNAQPGEGPGIGGKR
jgi:flagellar protein FlgJ